MWRLGPVPEFAEALPEIRTGQGRKNDQVGESASAEVASDSLECGTDRGWIVVLKNGTEGDEPDCEGTPEATDQDLSSGASLPCLAGHPSFRGPAVGGLDTRAQAEVCS